MVLLGLLLLAAGVATAIAVATENTDQTSFDMFGQTVEDVTMGGLFLIGCAVGAASLLGLWMIAAGLKRARLRRAQNRHVVTQTRTRAEELEDENNALRARLERADSTRVMTASSPGSYDYDSDVHRDRDQDTAFTRDRDHDGVADRSEGDTERTATMEPVRDDGGFGRDRDHDGVADREATPYADRSAGTTSSGAVYPAEPGRDDSVHEETAQHGRRPGLLGRDR
jgi:hypothetical protein